MDGIRSAFDRAVSDSYVNVPPCSPAEWCGDWRLPPPPQADWCSSRFTQRPAAFATRLDEFSLTDDSGEDADRPEALRRWRSPERSRCKILLLLLGLLLMFVIGTHCKTTRIFSYLFIFSPPLVPTHGMPVISLSPGFLVGEASHRQPQDKPKDGKGGGAHQADAEDGVPKPRPAPSTQLYWNNISQILKQKLNSKAFDETLPCVKKSSQVPPLHHRER